MNAGDLITDNLAIFPELALVLFLIVFVTVVVRALRRPAREMRGAAMIPLSDEHSPKGGPIDER